MGGEKEGEGERGRRKRWMDAEEIDEGRKKVICGPTHSPQKIYKNRFEIWVGEVK